MKTTNRRIRRLAGLLWAAAALCAAGRPAPADELDDFAREVAGRSEALGKLFGHLNSPEAARELVDSLASGDPASFHGLLDGIDLPLAEKCYWLRDVIERLVSVPAGRVEECWLKDDLTPEQRLVYLLIALRHRPVAKHGPGSGFQIVLGRVPIPPGPFLDELKAHDLVDCHDEVTYESSTVILLSEPTRYCLERP